MAKPTEICAAIQKVNSAVLDLYEKDEYLLSSLASAKWSKIIIELKKDAEKVITALDHLRAVMEGS